MNVVLWEGVIVVVNVGAEAVENRSQKWVEPFASAQNARARGPAVGSKRRDRDIHRGVVGATQRATNDIKDCPLRFMDNIRWYRFKTTSENVVHQLCRYSHVNAPRLCSDICSSHESMNQQLFHAHAGGSDHLCPFRYFCLDKRGKLFRARRNRFGALFNQLD